MREGEILRHIFRQNHRLPDHVTIPPGDDMAGLRIGGADVLVTVDQLIDGVHFRLDDTPLELIGRKAMTRNVSDVAAMAALPVGAVAAASLPASFTEDQARALFDAMRQVAERYGCPLVGGDISVHNGPLTLTVTVLAEPGGVKPVTRNGARVGDVVAVTGALGGAWSADSSGGDHLTFEPRVRLARKLATLPGVTLHSMIDLSDGLATDLRHICELSGVGAEVERGLIPLRGGATPEKALSDGEDYELLFTLPHASARHLPDDIDEVPITRIGRIIEGARLFLLDGSERRELTRSGWEHHG